MTKQQQKIYLALSASAIVIIVLLLFLISPSVSKLKALSRNLNENNSTLLSYKEKGGDYLAQLKSDYNVLGQKISEINNSFVNPEKAIDFILAVEHLANITKNYEEIVEITPQQEKQESKALFFRVSLIGSFPNLVKFLAQLENMDYFVDFDSLDIITIDEGDLAALKDKNIVASAGDIKSAINIKVYTK